MNIPPHDNPSVNSDRDWQAFLYVSGEMSFAEAEAFEAQLADDQSAREAVAEAVQLLAKVAAGASLTTNAAIDTRAPNRRWRVFAALVTAAALVLVCLSLFLHQPSGRDSSPARELVSLWAESENSADDAVEAEAAATLEDEDLTVPGWMLAAVETAPQKNAAKNTEKKAEED